MLTKLVPFLMREVLLSPHVAIGKKVRRHRSCFRRNFSIINGKHGQMWWKIEGLEKTTVPNAVWDVIGFQKH
jgi:hypothetical protein